MEAGPHAELLAAGGKYAELWARQQAHVDEVREAGLVWGREARAEGSGESCAGRARLECKLRPSLLITA